MAGDKILAIDDEISYRTLYRDLLAPEGYVVHVAENAGMALRLWRKERFDLIIADHSMEGINGIQLLELVRELDPVLPVVIAGPEDAQETILALRKGAIDYVNKPFDPEEFKSAIRAILERSQILREKTSPVAPSQGVREPSRILEVLEKAREILLTTTGEAAFQSLLNLALDVSMASKGGFLWRERDSSSYRLRAQRGLFAPPLLPPTITGGQGIIGAILAKGSPAILGPIKEETKETFFGKAGTLILPIERMGEVLGGIILGDKLAGDPFVQGDVDSLTPIAHAASLQLERLAKPPSEEAERREAFLEGFQLLVDQASLEDLVDKEIKKSQRYGRSFSVALMNLDELRTSIERAVSITPQEVNRQLYESILQTIRSADIAARMENGEVGLLLPETNHQGAIAAARRIRHAVQELQILHGISLASPSPIVLGIACFPEHGLSKDELFDRVRQAMMRSAESASRFESLWGYIDKLISEARITSELLGALSGSREKRAEEFASLMKDSDQPLPTGAHSKELQYVASWEDFQVFCHYVEDKILERLAGEGIFYVGLRELSHLEPKLEKYYRMMENGVKVFVFAKDDWEGWDPREITPIVTEDPALLEYSFFIYYGVSACYALMGRQREKEGMSGFFTISEFLVNEIMKKITGTYL